MLNYACKTFLEVFFGKAWRWLSASLNYFAAHLFYQLYEFSFFLQYKKFCPALYKYVFRKKEKKTNKSLLIVERLLLYGRDN